MEGASVEPGQVGDGRRRTLSRLTRMLLLLGLVVGLVGVLAAALRTPGVASLLVAPSPLPSSTPTSTPSPTATASSTPTRTPSPTRTASSTPTRTASSTPTRTPSPTATAVPSATATPSPEPASPPGPYTVYLEAASKQAQAYQYSCEFDAAWVVLQSYGFDVGVDELIARMPRDESVEPSYREEDGTVYIDGGDILTSYSGDYRSNFLARTTGQAISQLFQGYGLETAPVSRREELERVLREGHLVWMKTTVDFKPGRPALWVTPSGATISTVLGNDHAVVVIGYGPDVVVIRDVLGPTSTNRSRPLEYAVSWEHFMRSWQAQSYDALAVLRPQR